MLLLALDTSGAVVTAAVHDGARTLAEHADADPRRHAELLAPAVETVLAAAGADRGDLTGIVGGAGPGPFTGLRVGLVTARTLGAVLGLPVHGVCSLDGLALALAGAGTTGEFVVTTDARRREVYWAGYRVDDGTLRRTEGPAVGAPAAVPLRGRAVHGRGAVVHAEVLAPAGPPAGPLDVTAGPLAELAARALTDPATWGWALRDAEPLYLRRPDAVPPGERKRVLR